MNNEDNPGQPISDSTGEPSPQTPVVGPARQQGEISNKIEGNTKDSNNETKELAREFRTVEIIQIVINASLGVIGVIALCIYYGQLVQMRKATEKAGISAEAAKRAAEAAECAVQQGIEHFRVDERAWIEIEPIKPILLTPRDAKFGAAFKYEIYPRNVGKTVARNIVVKAQGSSSTIEFGGHAYEMNSIQDKMLLDKFKEGGTTKPFRIPSNPVPKVLAPSTTASVPFTLIGQEPQIFPKSEWVSYLIGRIDYCDEFQVRHWIKFCFFVVNSRGELWNCKEGNDEDHNPETPPTPSCSAPP